MVAGLSALVCFLRKKALLQSVCLHISLLMGTGRYMLLGTYLVVFGLSV